MGRGHRIAALVIATVSIAGCVAASTGSPPATDPTLATATSAPLPSRTPFPAGPTKHPGPQAIVMETFPVPVGSHPHDVAPAVDGGVWYTAQGSGELGWLDPVSGDVREIPLGPGSAPHGVIVGPDGAAWITDGGLNAILRYDPETETLDTVALDSSSANLNTAAFDGDGILWFTGQAGFIGRVDPATGEVEVFSAPRGRGPYGITATPDGEVWFSSLAGSYLGAIDRQTGAVTVIETPTPGGGGRRVWSDSRGRLWVTEWFAGKLAMYDPALETWQEWDLPGGNPQPYAVYVDDQDLVWVTDFGANAIHRFDPRFDAFTTHVHDSQPAEVRQLLGRPGELWGAESGADGLVLITQQG